MTKTSDVRIPDYLTHILEVLRRILEYTENIDQLGFLKDALIQECCSP
ncbi:MAG: hypothetical protein K0Q74_401 [Gammaproteobacteria bacterium]|jgi:uncharacterized protein with HEPN domain|nr:hypothetical protein [Gammaproteobacteria bacterium]